MKKTRMYSIDVRNDARHSDPTYAAVARLMAGEKPAIVYKKAWTNPKPYVAR